MISWIITKRRLSIFLTAIPLVIIAISYTTPLIAKGYLSPFIPHWALLFLAYIAFPMLGISIGQLFPTPSFVLSFMLLASGSYFVFLYVSLPDNLNVPLAGVGEVGLAFVLILNGMAWFSGARIGRNTQRAMHRSENNN